MTHDEIIALVQAHKEGKTLQYMEKPSPDVDARWENYPGLIGHAAFSHYLWRIKPEPVGSKEIFINVGNTTCESFYYVSRNNANATRDVGATLVRYVRAEDEG
jgi:hypothetical protein